MNEEDWLRRIDGHLEDIRRGNETARDYMREGHELMARLDDTMERNRVAFEDLHEYLQQATTILGALVAEVRGGEKERREEREEAQEWRKETREWRKEWRRETREWRKETRVWHRALSEKVDRLKPEPPPHPA